MFINQDQFCYKLQFELNWLQQARPSLLLYRSGWDPKRLKQTMKIHHLYTQPYCRASNLHLASTKQECWPLAVAHRLTRFWAISIHFPSSQLMYLRGVRNLGLYAQRTARLLSRCDMPALRHVRYIHNETWKISSMHARKHTRTHTKNYVNICVCFLGVLKPFCTVWKITPANITWSCVCFV